MTGAGGGPGPRVRHRRGGFKPSHPLVFLWWVAVAGASAAAGAQSMLRGAVRSDSSGAYIAGAEITIASLGRVARSGEGGRYLVDSLPPGPYEVVARAIGCSGKMIDFERRRRLGFGQFLDRDHLRSVENQPLSIALRTLVSIRLVVRPQSCGGGVAAASGRGGSFGSGGQQLYCSADPQRGFPPACYLSLYLDGLRVWAWDAPEPPNLDDYRPASLEGIEVYRGASQLPAELNSTGNACGALLLWTRTGGGP